MLISAIDLSDDIRVTAARIRFLGRVVDMPDVSTMVSNVIAKVGQGREITRLNIIDHGTRDEGVGFQMGSDWVNQWSLRYHGPKLVPLRPLFAADAFVHFQNCHAGSHEIVIMMLARILNVPVFAGTKKHHSLLGVNLGQYVCAHPEGTFEQGTLRPGRQIYNEKLEDEYLYPP